MQERTVDIDAAQETLHAVEDWGSHYQDDLAEKHARAENALLGLVLTGVQADLWPGTPEANQFLLDKLKIAFEMGCYYSYYGRR